MERAASHNQGPLVLADRADNPGSGAPGDSTFVLRALVDRQIGPALFGVMWDPMAFRIAEEAGEGAKIRMRLGGKSGAVSGDPVDLDVTVKKIARGVRQPYGPVMVPLGDMALLSSEHVDVAICTIRTQTFHADAFKAVGADPADYRVVVVKSAQHFYNGFVGLAKEILYVASPGAADPDVTRLALHQAQDAVLAQSGGSLEIVFAGSAPLRGALLQVSTPHERHGVARSQHQSSGVSASRVVLPSTTGTTSNSTTSCQSAIQRWNRVMSSASMSWKQRPRSAVT